MNLNSLKITELDLEDINRIANQYIEHQDIYGRFKGRGIPIKKGDKDILKIEKAYEQFQCFRQKYPISGARILEIGSGFGGFVLVGNLEGAIIYGIEPDPMMVQVSRQFLDSFNLNENLIRCCQAEELKFEDNLFDFVVSFQVLEHVEDPGQVLRESVRVLKSGGIMYFIIPNYNSFYEGHIGKPWFPFINKTNVKWYLKFLNIDKDHLNHVNFITPKFLQRVLSELDVELISMGKNEQFDRFNEKEINKIRNWFIRFLLNVVFFLKLEILISKILIKFNWFYPIVLVVRKN